MNKRNLEYSENFLSESLEAKIKPELPKLTLLVMRHGESSEDKSDPNRGLTEIGQQQVRESFAEFLDKILAEENPEFNQWNNPEAKKIAFAKIAPKLEFHLRDSGTYRTQEQEWIQAEMLNEIGVTEINLPKSAYDFKSQESPQSAGPGVAKRLKGVQGMDKNKDFRKLIGQTDYQKTVGAVDEMTAWALTPEKDVPQGVETYPEMMTRYQNDLAKLQRLAQSRKIKEYPKRIIVIANSHASILTLASSGELSIPLTKLGEIENAEGLRLDFYDNNQYQASPFGEKTESIVNKPR